MRATHYTYAAIPDSIKLKISDLQENLLADDIGFSKLGYFKINSSYLHLTIGVFKLADDSKVSSMQDDVLKNFAEDILNRVMKNMSPPHFDIVLKGIKCFNDGNVIFIEVEKSNALQRIRDNIIAEFEKKDIYLADERFNPHLTIFKMPRGRQCCDISEVRKALSKVSVPKFEKIKVDELYFSAIKGKRNKKT